MDARIFCKAKDSGILHCFMRPNGGIYFDKSFLCVIMKHSDSARQQRYFARQI